MATVAQTVIGRYTDAGNTASVIQTPTGVDTAATGNTFVIGFTHDPGAGTVALTDNKGNTYDTSLRQGPIRTGNGHCQLYVIQNALGGAGHRWTITFPSPAYSPLFVQIISGAISGIDTAGVVGRDGVTTQNLIASTGTLAQADNLLCGIVGNPSGGTITTTSPTMSIDGQEGDAGLFWPGAIVSYQTPATTAIDITVTAPNQTGSFMNGQFVVLKAGAAQSSPAADFDHVDNVGDINTSATIGVSAASSTTSRRGILVASATIVAGAITAAAAIVGSAGIAESSASTQVAAQYEVARSSGSASGASTIANTLSANALRSSGNLASGVPPSLGSHGEDHDLQGPVSNSLQIAIPTQSGSTFLVFHTGLQGNADPTDNKANTLARLTPWTAQPLWTSYGVEMFGVVDGIGGADHVFAIDKTPSTRPDEEASAIAVEVIGGTQIVGPDIIYIATASPPYSTPTVTVDGPATVFALWAGEDGGGPHTVSASDGFTFVDGWLDGVSGSIQFALFSKTVAAPGTYGTTFTSTPSQGGLFGICAVRGGISGPSAALAVAASFTTGRASGGSIADAASTILASSETTARTGGVAASASIPPLGSISASSESARAQALLDASGSVGLSFGAAHATPQVAATISANTAILAASEASASGSGSLSASAQSEILASSSTAGRPAELSASATIPIPGQIHASFVYSANAGTLSSASALLIGAQVQSGGNGAFSGSISIPPIGFIADHLTVAYPASIGAVKFTY